MRLLLDTHALTELPLTARHSQALAEGLVFLTLDRNCRSYDVPVFPFR